MSECVCERKGRERERQREREKRANGRNVCCVCVRVRDWETLLSVIDSAHFFRIEMLQFITSIITPYPCPSSFFTPLHSSSLLTLTFLLSTSLQHFTLNIFISTLPVVSFTNLTLFLLYSLANFSHFFHSI